MSVCSVCGNDYQQSFVINHSGKSYTFDCFECAIHQLAPLCQHCGCKIIGHGIQVKNTCYCCAHCARQAGISEAKDHV